MPGFKTRGTTWTIIIAPDGSVQFNDFHIKPEAAKTLIKSLKGKEKKQVANGTFVAEGLRPSGSSAV